MLIDWPGLKAPSSLMDALSDFLTKVFGERLREEAKKLDLYAPKGRPESFEYLRPIGVHKAARWYRLLEKLKERGYLFDLRFSAEIEELMNLMFFAYAFDSLVARGVLTLDGAVVKGRLYDKDGFESLIYEVLVASNYALNGFEVSMPDLSGKERVDIYARKGNIEVYCECKKLRRKEQYVDLAIKVMSKLHQKGLSLLVDVELLKRPKSIERLIELVEKAAEEKRPLKSDEAVIQVQYLPELVEGVYELAIPRPETIEYLVSAAYPITFFKVLPKRPKGRRGHKSLGYEVTRRFS